MNSRGCVGRAGTVGGEAVRGGFELSRHMEVAVFRSSASSSLEETETTQCESSVRLSGDLYSLSVFAIRSLCLVQIRERNSMGADQTRHPWEDPFTISAFIMPASRQWRHGLYTTYWVKAIVTKAWWVLSL